MQAAASPAAALSLQRFFSVPVSALGVSNAAVAQIAMAAMASHPDQSQQGWTALADRFARLHGYHEYLILASALLAKAVRAPDPNQDLFVLIASWLENDVENWAQCDDLCIKPLYLYLQRHPHVQHTVIEWGMSASPWLRRASNVGLVKFVGRSTHLHVDRVLANCARLLADQDPYVQKGIGWMLKVASQRAPEPTLNFLRIYAPAMARPTLRCAIEKLTPGHRRKFLETAP